MTKHKKKKLELLAPAGTIQVFETAVNEGADAIYIGAPALNARALAKHFTMAEIAAMVSFAHKNNVKVYVAMNSLLKEEEIPQAVETLSAFETLRIDGLILQDLGIYYLAKKYFPKLRLHASTLLCAHNSLAVKQLDRMGFSRVVLARESTLEEIAQFHKSCPVELEVFVHGAMCFSYSGLCMFSSYLGGKSGLRGRCVQPCRRRYTWTGRGKGHRSGYLFSMNDLCGIDLIPQIQQAGVTSLKIEGRMRSAHYVGSVLRAYRKVIDGPAGDKNILANARDLLQEAMGRKETKGYFLNDQPQDILTPQHSGNIGLFLGKIVSSKYDRARLVLKEPVNIGDRLRLHIEKSGERNAFTVKNLLIHGKTVNVANKGKLVTLELPIRASKGDSLYKVDLREQRFRPLIKQAIQPGRFKKEALNFSKSPRIERIIDELEKLGRPKQSKGDTQNWKSKKRRSKSSLPMAWWLKIDDLRALQTQFYELPDRLLVNLSQETFSQYAKMKRTLTPFKRNMAWSLPAIIPENELLFYENAIRRLQQNGFMTWQIGHIGQLLFFEKETQGTKPREVKSKKRHFSQTLTILGDYTFNILNSLSIRTLKEQGVNQLQASIETDKENLQNICKQRLEVMVGITAYGTLPLFTARIAAGFFHYGRSFVSPKGEAFLLKKNDSLTIALPDKPFSLLPHLKELSAMGIQYAVVDLSNIRLKRGGVGSVIKQLTIARKGRRLSTFNYRGSLQ